MSRGDVWRKGTTFNILWCKESPPSAQSQQFATPSHIWSHWVQNVLHYILPIHNLIVAQSRARDRLPLRNQYEYTTRDPTVFIRSCWLHQIHPPWSMLEWYPDRCSTGHPFSSMMSTPSYSLFRLSRDFSGSVADTTAALELYAACGYIWIRQIRCYRPLMSPGYLLNIGRRCHQQLVSPYSDGWSEAGIRSLLRILGSRNVDPLSLRIQK